MAKITKINKVFRSFSLGAGNQPKKEKEMKENKNAPLLVGVVSLGCDKNRVDTENMMTYLNNNGNFAFVGDPAEADVIIINSCAFIESARSETKENITEMIEYRKKGKCKCLVVTGCYPQKYLSDATDNFPEVDIFLGTNEYENIASIILDFITGETKEQITKTTSPYCLNEPPTNRLITTASHYAYIKIADGCDNFCSYCTIPYIRGRFRSRKMEDIYAEAESLVQAGAKELILVAQDTARYGYDLYGKNMLAELTQMLSKITGLVWIRLLYCYPEHITDELIEVISENEKVCAYIDVPFQHVSSDVLKRMNRKINKEKVIEIVNKLKETENKIAIRTTFIVGFPGETKEDFNELLDFIKTYELPNVGFFTYSREDGTVAARFENQIPEATKHSRLLKAVKAQKKVVTKYNKSLIGETHNVVLEGYDEKKRLYIGRSEYQAPEIDTITYFSSLEPLTLGEIYKVTIIKAKGYDLYGVINTEEN